MHRLAKPGLRPRCVCTCTRVYEFFSAYQNIKVQKIVPGCNFSVKTNRYFPKFSSRSNARVEKGKDYFALNKRARTEIKVGLDLIGPRGYQHKILIALASCSTIEPACAYEKKN